MDKVELEMGDEHPSRYLANQSVNTGPRVAAGETQCKSPDQDGLDGKIVSAAWLCGLVIELSSWVKGHQVKVLLNLGVIGNFISDAMATVLNFKITGDMDFQDLMLPNGSQVWTTGYV